MNGKKIDIPSISYNEIDFVKQIWGALFIYFGS